jgi:hypothetical protein
MNLTEHTDFAAEYRAKTDEQLLQIAGEGDLLDEARLALHSEMQTRKLTPEMVKDYRAETQRYELAQRAEDPNVSRSLLGMGFSLFGRAYLSEEDRAHGIQVRTKWFTLRGLPVIPIASYRYSCHDVTTGLIHWKEEKVIDRVGLNWRQVGLTWLKTTGLFVFAALLFIAFLAWRDRTQVPHS